MKLHINDIIDNMRDELDRTRELLLDNEDAEYSMLLSDIESSLERTEDLKERIEFALILAVYAGIECVIKEVDVDCEDSEWRNKYLQAASEVEFEYEGGFISSEWAYNTASDIVRDMMHETIQN